MELTIACLIWMVSMTIIAIDIHCGVRKLEKRLRDCPNGRDESRDVCGRRHDVPDLR